MGKVKNIKGISTFTPNFCSGIAAILSPTKRSKQLRKTVMSMTQSDGLYEDWAAVGNDFHNAMSKFNAGMTWQRK